MRRAIIWIVTFAIAVVAVAFLIAFFKTVWWWVEVHTGTTNEPGPYYGFFSGFGSDLGEAAILVGLIKVARVFNCATKGCPRVTRHTVEDPDTHVKYHRCHKHHPGIPNEHSHHGWWSNHMSDEFLDDLHRRHLEATGGGTAGGLVGGEPDAASLGAGTQAGAPTPDDAPTS